MGDDIIKAVGNYCPHRFFYNLVRVFGPVCLLLCVVVVMCACATPGNPSARGDADGDAAREEEDADRDDDTGSNTVQDGDVGGRDLLYRKYVMGTQMPSSTISISVEDIEAVVAEPQQVAVFLDDNLMRQYPYEPKDGEMAMVLEQSGCYCFLVSDSNGEWTDVTDCVTIWVGEQN